MIIDLDINQIVKQKALEEEKKGKNYCSEVFKVVNLKYCESRADYSLASLLFSLLNYYNNIPFTYILYIPTFIVYLLHSLAPYKYTPLEFDCWSTQDKNKLKELERGDLSTVESIEFTNINIPFLGCNKLMGLN